MNKPGVFECVLIHLHGQKTKKSQYLQPKPKNG